MARQHSILIVEDNVGDAELVRIALRDAAGDAFRLRRVGRLDEALDLLGRESFDAMLLDLSLPDGSPGTTLDVVVRAKSDVPVVVLTGVDDSALGERLVREGAQDYLVKGDITGESVARALRHAIERRAIGRTLERTRSEALAASAAKSDFIAEFSHEVRTPLNAILGMADMLADTKLDAEQAQYARIIATAARRLLSYTNDTLDAVRLEAGRLELERRAFAVADEVRQVAELLTPLAARKGLALALEIAPQLPPAIMGDAARLRSILVNLIGNAIKYTRHGQVLVRVARCPEDESRQTLLLTVADTGVGIPAEKLEAIFEPFARTGPRRRDSSGLGLWLVRRLVTLMGGRLWVSSVPDEGSTFTFTVHFDLP